METPLLFLQALASLYMTGLIWFVQLVHYPMLAEVPEDRFIAFEESHQSRTTWAVGPMMLVEAATALAFLWLSPSSIPGWIPWVGVALLLLVDGSTAAFFGPQHVRLARGFNSRLHRQLVQWNWLRTAGWTARGLLLLWALSLAD